jgi:hypothetical protein
VTAQTRRSSRTPSRLSLLPAVALLAACGGAAPSTSRAPGTAEPLPWLQPTGPNGPSPAKVLLARASGHSSLALTAGTTGAAETGTQPGEITLDDVTDILVAGGQVVGTPLPPTVTSVFDDGTTQSIPNVHRYAVFIGGLSPFAGVDIDVTSSDPSYQFDLRGYYVARHDSSEADGWHASYGWGLLIHRAHGMPCCEGTVPGALGPSGYVETTDFLAHPGTLAWSALPIFDTANPGGWYRGVGDGQMLRNAGFPAPDSMDQTLYWALLFVDVLDPAAPGTVPSYTITGLRFHQQ